MDNEKFSREEIPYEILQKFGLSQQMIDDLPANVAERFLCGKTTPPLPVIMENIEGLKIVARARIKMVRLSDGKVDICFSGIWEDKDLNIFSLDQQEKLLRGDVTIATLPEKGECFIQYDENIKQVLAYPAFLIKHNISLLVENYQLSEEEKKKIESGKILELQIQNRMLTIGIDLNDMCGVRIINGNLVTWLEDAKVDHLPQYNFGLYGCWVADDDNRLTYVPEDEYTEDMISEFTRRSSANAAEEKSKHLTY